MADLLIKLPLNDVLYNKRVKLDKNLFAELLMKNKSISLFKYQYSLNVLILWQSSQCLHDLSEAGEGMICYLYGKK